MEAGTLPKMEIRHMSYNYEGQLPTVKDDRKWGHSFSHMLLNQFPSRMPHFITKNQDDYFREDLQYNRNKKHVIASYIIQFEFKSLMIKNKNAKLSISARI